MRMLLHKLTVMIAYIFLRCCFSALINQFVVPFASSASSHLRNFCLYLGRLFKGGCIKPFTRCNPALVGKIQHGRVPGNPAHIRPRKSRNGGIVRWNDMEVMDFVQALYSSVR